MLPSVTQILSPWQDFSQVCPDVLEAACVRGSQVHQICAAIAQGYWVPDIPAGCEGFIDSFRLWYDTAVSSVVMVEKRLTDKTHGFTGTPDLICFIKGDGNASVIDLKSPAVHSHSWRLQLAAYRHLASREMTIKRCFSLRLSKEGKRAKVVEYSETAHHDFSIFLSALNVWRFFNG